MIENNSFIIEKKGKKVTIVFFALFLFGYLGFGQKQWIVSPTELYTAYDTNKKAIGVLLRGAVVEVLSTEQSLWTKVKVDNGMIGFVDSAFIRKALNASDHYLLSPSPIIENDGHYGSPHLFVQVASLRIRELPSPDAKIVSYFTMGEVAAVDFYPYDPNAWVNVDKGFIQQKYLGARPKLENLYHQFDTISLANRNGRKKIAERLVEFAWNSSGSKVPALERFLSVAEELGDKKKIGYAKLQIQIAKGLTQTLDYKELEAIGKSEETYIKINGIQFPNYTEVTYSEMLEVLGEPIKIIEGEDDCCYSGNQSYCYDHAEFVVDKQKNLAEIVWIGFKGKGNVFVINGTPIDKNTTEEEFVNLASRWVYYNGKYPNEYDLPFLDYCNIIISFKDGKAEKLSLSLIP
ncbi:SH3 domain-containing protein [Aquimarina algiphila]|uniref:SH3 domain-containing protein n=1 Tax=Aquimarina algiphila TaxID=2047982 RepID=UPI002492A9E0|nr:SH3 domain-containing protein [Aquimarina algiphila]